MIIQNKLQSVLMTTMLLSFSFMIPLQAEAKTSEKKTWAEIQNALCGLGSLNKKPLRYKENCLDNFNTTKTSGKQRLHIIQTFIGTKRSTPQDIDFQEIKTDNLQMINVTFINRYNVHTYKSYYNKIYDIQSKKEIAFIDTIKMKQRSVLKNKIRNKFNKYIAEHKKYRWKGTPQTDSERKKWLDDNIDKIFIQNGRFIVKDSVLTLKFCSAHHSNDRAFYGCIEIPSKPYLKGKYNPDVLEVIAN